MFGTEFIVPLKRVGNAAVAAHECLVDSYGSGVDENDPRVGISQEFISVYRPSLFSAVQIANMMVFREPWDQFAVVSGVPEHHLRYRPVYRLRSGS